MWLREFLAKHKTFVGNVAAMMSGKSLAAAIALFTTAIVARLFTPSDFGIAAAFLSIISITAIVATLRYDLALVLPKEDAEAVAVMALTYYVLFAVCIAMLLALTLYEAAGWSWPLLEMLDYWMWFLPLGVLLMAALQIQEQWLARKAAFKLVAATVVAGTLVNSGTRIGFGLLSGSSVFALIFSNILGMLCRLVLQKTAGSDDIRARFGHANRSELREMARRYADFPKLNAPAGLMFSLGQNLPVLLFGIMFSPAVAGLYAMANRLSQVPVTIVANSIRRVFLQKAAEINNLGRNLRKAFLLTTGGLALLGVVPFGCLWAFGQPLLEWLLGERWSVAGHYLEVMAPWLLMLWVTAPSNPVFIVLRRQKVWLVMQVCLTFLRLGAFGLAYILSAGPELTLQYFVIATVIGSVLTIVAALMLIVNDKESSQNTKSTDMQAGATS
jgi:O-antigen/teichoic acid export membrane protein